MSQKQLTALENKYWMCIKPQSGVVYLKGRPGIAKSALTRSIADKMGMQYIDLRLSQKDETDVGTYPEVGQRGGIDCVKYIPPEWAIKANEKPTLIHFEELNRATHQVRNAALQLLLERCIGAEFEFNENVYMIASGNLGEEDGCDVEELDKATNGRLIHFTHELTIPEWKEGYADEHVLPFMLSFIEAHPEEYYPNVDNSDGKAYASPRTWAFLSDAIKSNFGTKPKIADIIPFLQTSAIAYIGHASATKFIRYCDDLSLLNVDDILNRYSDVAEALEQFNRGRISEMMASLRERNVNEMTKKQLANLLLFVENQLGDDERMSYLIFIVDKFFTTGVDNNASTIMEKYRLLLKKGYGNMKKS